MRVLVTVSPRLYRESVTLSIQRGRPDLEVRAASPEETELVFYEEAAHQRPGVRTGADRARGHDDAGCVAGGAGAAGDGGLARSDRAGGSGLRPLYALIRGGRGERGGGLGPIPERGIHVVAGLRMLAGGLAALALGVLALWSYFAG